MIRGKGFYATEDKLEYYANFSGRAEYSNGYMVVSHVLEITGDVDNTYGDIDFIGDVKVYGDVITRMTVKASGFITVEGHVEGAHLIAGKGVILKNGMQGNGIGRIDTTGEVEGRFFEQTAIHATGSLHANAILNCDIEVEGNVIVEGTMGALVAGRTRAGVLVQAAYIGNTVGITTKVIVGSEGNEAARIKKLQEELVEANQELYKSEGKIKMLEEAIEKGMGDKVVMDVKKELLRQKIVLAAEIKDKEAQCRKLGAVLEYSSGAQVVIQKQAYPGTWVTVNGAHMRVPDVVKNITIKKKGEDACMFANV